MSLQPPNLTLLPSDLRSRVQSELLDAGERLLWIAQPDARRFARDHIEIVLFGLLWTTSALFLIFIASGGFWGLFDAGMNFPDDQGAFRIVTPHPPVWLPVFGLPFVLIGFGMLSTPYRAWRKAKRTVYAVTDRRVILLEGGSWNSTTVRTYMPSQLQRMTRTERPDGSGDLILEEWCDSDGSDREYIDENGNHRVVGDDSHHRYGMFAIPRVREVEELIRTTLLEEDSFVPMDRK